MERDRKPAVMFWTPAPASSSGSDELSEEEEQGDFQSQMDENGVIGLEHTLDEIGLGADSDEVMDHELNLEVVNTDLDVSEDEGFRPEKEYSHTPTKCLNENISPEMPHVPQERTSKHYCPEAQPASTLRAPSLPLLISLEELAVSPGIMDEILPKIHFSDSLSDSDSSLRSNPRPQRPIACNSHNPTAEMEKRTLNDYCGVSKIPVKVSPTQKRQPFPEDTRLSTTSLHKAGAGSFKSSCQTKLSPDREGRTPGTRTNAAQLAEFRSGALGVRMPDFSKVEPRVRFPKDGYTPPKSCCPLRRDSLSPEPALMFKSPADIVKEVLLNPSNELDPQEDSASAPAPVSIVPPEFRSRQQATALMDELQEDNYRLKIKCAEAENTIDRLRLEGKVNLYSDPPKPGLPLHSGLRTEASKPMTLEIPQTQRAAFTSSSPQTEAKSPQHKISPPSTSTSSSCSHFVDKLYEQAQMFQQKVEAYKAMLQSGKLTPVEQMKVLPELIQRLDCLEKDYMLAKEKHERQKRQWKDIGSFDPERELESLVFQCGLQMDELMEQVHQEHQDQPTGQTQPTQQAPPPLLFQTPPSSVHSGGERPQYPPPAALSGPRSAAPVVRNMTSASEEDENQTLKSTFFEPLSGKGGHDEPDFTQLYQSLKVLPKPLVRDLSEDFFINPSLLRNPEREYEEGRRYSMANTQEMHSSHDRRVTPSPGPSAQTSSSSVRSKHPQTLPIHPPSSRTSEVGQSYSQSPSSRTSKVGVSHSHSPGRRGSEVGQSHSSSLSSLRDAPERKDHKPSSDKQRRFSQDGVLSPETDSGFLGSEGSRLTPAAADSPVHQREPPGVSRNASINPCPAPSLSRLPNEGLAVRPQQTKRSRKGERRHTLSASQCTRPSHTHRAADSESSESGLNSHHTHSTSEEDQGDHFTGSIISPRGPSSHQHVDLLKAPNTGRGARHNEAFQLLQAEVVQLKDNMEMFVKNRVRAERSLPSTSTPVSRSDRQKASHRVRQGRQKNDEDIQAEQKRSVSTKLSQTDSCLELQPFPQQVSRFTQTSAAEPYSSHSDTFHRRSHFSHSCERTEEADDRQTRAPVCAECLSPGKCSDGSVKEKASNHSSHYHHCGLCGRSESDSFRHRGTQTVSSSGTADRSTHSAVHHVPLCSPPPLLLYSYSSPIHLSPTKSEDHSRVRGHREVRSRRSVSAERQKDRLLEESLDRALRAARVMKHTSRHMAHTLASGLQYQQTLAHTR